MLLALPWILEDEFYLRRAPPFDARRAPAWRVVLVDHERPYALDEIALLEALPRHTDFHAQAAGEIQVPTPLKLFYCHRQHGGRAGGEELQTIRRPLRVRRAGFLRERLYDLG